MITQIASPSGTPSVHDNMWHIVASDNSGTTDFKYVFDIWIDGVQKIRVKQFPEPQNGKAYFDAGPTVRNEMEYDWFEPINSSVLVAQPNMQGQAGIVYALRIGEEVSGTTTLNMASGQVSGYNWAPPLFKRREITLTTKANKWLTNRPVTNFKTKIGENLFAGFYITPGVSSVDFKVEKFNGSNTSQGVTTTAISVTGQFLQLNIGTTAIQATTGVLIDEFTKYYDVWINSLEKVRVYIKCNPKYTPYPVHFLNRWGMWDTQRFDLVSKLEMKIDRKGFGQRDYRFGATSVDYHSSANRYYEGKIDYSNKANWNYKLTADAMTDSEYEWMADLIHSPQILVEIDSYFYPVTIKQNDFEYRKIVNDKLKPLEVEFEFNSERYTQLR